MYSDDVKIGNSETYSSRSSKSIGSNVKSFLNKHPSIRKTIAGVSSALLLGGSGACVHSEQVRSVSAVEPVSSQTYSQDESESLESEQTSDIAQLVISISCEDTDHPALQRIQPNPYRVESGTSVSIPLRINNPCERSIDLSLVDEDNYSGIVSLEEEALIVDATDLVPMHFYVEFKNGERQSDLNNLVELEIYRPTDREETPIFWTAGINYLFGNLHSHGFGLNASYDFLRYGEDAVIGLFLSTTLFSAAEQNIYLNREESNSTYAISGGAVNLSLGPVITYSITENFGLRFSLGLDFLINFINPHASFNCDYAGCENDLEDTFSDNIVGTNLGGDFGVGFFIAGDEIGVELAYRMHILLPMPSDNGELPESILNGVTLSLLFR